jgi:hypothetical protein
MKIRFEKNYILIVSPMLVYICGLASGTPSLTKGVAFFPFLLVKSEEYLQPWLINHEVIHFKQQIETLLIGALLLDVAETLYAVLIKRITFREAYAWRSGEQEAYRNHHNPNYLQERKLWARFWYLTHKREFEVIGFGEIEYKDVARQS